MRLRVLATALMILSACSGDDAYIADPVPPESDPPSETQPPPRELTETPIAFIGVEVIPMDSERVLSNQTVVIRDGLIAEVGSAESIVVDTSMARIEPPDGVTWYLIPGLADMHIHPSDARADRRNDLELYLAAGVTSIRVMWGSSGATADRSAVQTGFARGPSVYVASPGMDGPEGPWTQFTPPITTEVQAVNAVEGAAALGYDFIKVYNDLRPEIYDVIVREASVHGIRVIGHVPRRVGYQTVLNAGQASVEHLIGIGLEASSTGSVFNGNLNLARVREIAAQYRDAGVWVTPTIFVDSQSASRIASIKNGSDWRYISDGLQSRFETGFFQGFATATQAEGNHKAIVATLREVGFTRFLAGTDAGFGYVLPGFSIHEEIRMLAEAGLTPFEALRAATSGAGEFLEGADVLGTVIAGRRAVLLLLSANPLDDVTNTGNRVGVMARGDWYSQEFLNDRLEEIADSYGH